MGPTGITPAVYTEFSDEYILILLGAERDEHGHVVTECDLARKKRRESGKVKDARWELPSREELGIPPEAFRWVNSSGNGIPTGFVIMFFQCWANRGKTPEETYEIWKDEQAKYGSKLR